MIDIYLSTMRLEFYEVCDDEGNTLEEGDEEQNLSYSTHVTTQDDWDLMLKRACTNEPVSLKRELLLSAQSFFEIQNYSMALLIAAILSEMLIHHLAVQSLVHTGKISWKDFNDQTKRGRVDLLRAFNVITDEHIDKIHKLKLTFDLRDRLVHPVRVNISNPLVVLLEQAQDAIIAAKYLEWLLRFYTPTTPNSPPSTV